MNQDKKELISVIIPCYNVEKYIEQCLDSVLNQGFRSIEVIVIDDYSTDNTYELIKKYNDPRLIVRRNKINQGVGFTRDYGVEVANGMYTLFIDPDDYLIDKGTLKWMYKKTNRNNFDMLSFGMKKVYEGKQIKQSIFGKISRILFRKPHYSNWNIWNKLYKTDWLKRQPKQELRNAQDLYFAVMTEPRYKHFRKKTLCYRVNAGSLSNKVVIPEQRKKDLVFIGEVIIKLKNNKYNWFVIENFIKYDWFESDEINNFIKSKNYKFSLYSKIRNQKRRLKKKLNKKEV